MKIILSPMRRDAQLTLSKSGDLLTLNGEAFDFSGLPNGATLPRSAITSDWFAGDVSRADAAEGETGELTVPLILPHGYNAPSETRFPAPLEAVADGPVDLPIYETPEPGPEPGVYPEPEEEPTEEPV